ncbi:MAG: bifunctional DNA-formamidopyrimidine glycosylase/DNA-(apurinic or apyrimidinic site) lyase [Maricaulaceae bacterium]
MPELPEVETVRRGVAPVWEGARLIRVEARRPDLRFPFPDRFADRLTGTRIERLERRAKYLLARLGSGETLLMHLGMSGRFTITGASVAARPGTFVHGRAIDPKHDHVVFETADARVTFNDPRRFGFMDLFAQDADCRYLRGLGPEPLSNQFDGPVLLEAAAKRRSPLKAILLDQKVVAGLGNIYVCEALHRAGLSPVRQGVDLVAEQADRLAQAVKAVLTEAIAAGGSSLRDYAQADGSLGYFQHAFRVYGQAGQPCPTPGCPGVVERSVQSNRSTFSCPLCQV